MSSQVSARKALKDARQGKKFCFRSDHSEGLFVMICLVVEAADEGGLKKHNVLV